MPAEGTRALAVVLHDVAPQTWPLYESFIASLDACADTGGRIPLTLLVVPDFHHRGGLAAHGRFCAAIEGRIARGDEVAMHGYYHSDDQPLRWDPIDYLRRRVYTHEGEFAALDSGETRRRLERGLALFSGFGWPIAGFVAPAWLMSRAAHTVLAEFPFRYTSNRTALFRLPRWQAVRTPSLVWSARSPWRRRASRLWSEWLLRRSADAGLIRLGLHPVDMRHGEARGFWLQTVQALLPARRALTKKEWLELENGA
jgi:predicted deacetylase